MNIFDFLLKNSLLVPQANNGFIVPKEPAKDDFAKILQAMFEPKKESFEQKATPLHAVAKPFQTLRTKQPTKKLPYQKSSMSHNIPQPEEKPKTKNIQSEKLPNMYSSKKIKKERINRDIAPKPESHYGFFDKSEPLPKVDVTAKKQRKVNDALPQMTKEHFAKASTPATTKHETAPLHVVASTSQPLPDKPTKHVATKPHHHMQKSQTPYTTYTNNDRVRTKPTPTSVPHKDHEVHKAPQERVKKKAQEKKSVESYNELNNITFRENIAKAQKHSPSNPTVSSRDPIWPQNSKKEYISENSTSSEQKVVHNYLRIEENQLENKKAHNENFVKEITKNENIHQEHITRKELPGKEYVAMTNRDIVHSMEQKISQKPSLQTHIAMQSVAIAMDDTKKQQKILQNSAHNMVHPPKSAKIKNTNPSLAPKQPMYIKHTEIHVEVHDPKTLQPMHHKREEQPMEPTTLQNQMPNSMHQTPDGMQDFSNQESFSHHEASDAHSQTSQLKDSEPFEIPHPQRHTITLKLDQATINVNLQQNRLYMHFISQTPMQIHPDIEEFISEVMQESGYERYRVVLKDREKRMAIASKESQKTASIGNSSINVKV